MNQTSSNPLPKFRSGQSVRCRTKNILGDYEVDTVIVAGVYNPSHQSVLSDNGMMLIHVPPGWLYTTAERDPRTGRNFAFHEKDIKLIHVPAEQSFDQLLESLRN